MIKRWIAWLICVVAVLLPWRLRVWFASALGWGAQGVYWLYARILAVLVKNLKPAGSSERNPPS